MANETVVSIPIAVAVIVFIIAAVAKPVTIVVAIGTVNAVAAAAIVATGRCRRQQSGCCIRWRSARAAEPPRSAAPQATRDAKADAGVGVVVTVRAK